MLIFMLLGRPGRPGQPMDNFKILKDSSHSASKSKRGTQLNSKFNSDFKSALRFLFGLIVFDKN